MTCGCGIGLAVGGAQGMPVFARTARDNQSDIGEPSRRIEHAAGGRNPETSEPRTGTLWTAVVDTMIAALPAPAIRALG
jgi:hypothetical protein